MYLKFNGKDVAGYLGDFSIEDSLENLYISVNFTLPYTRQCYQSYSDYTNEQ